MQTPSPIELVGAVLFALAIAHTFAAKYFEHLADIQPKHAGIWHLLGEVEVVFGLWATVLVVTMMVMVGKHAATDYLDTRNFTEPLFVFAIMLIAATRPVLHLAQVCVRILANALPMPKALAMYFLLLAFVPLLGSLITEPAAMTLAALMLRDTLFSRATSTRLKYATLGVLFVNISIGGTLTPFAAPPVLMVAAKWNWDMAFMLTHFGWKAAIAVMVNATLASWLFRRQLTSMDTEPPPKEGDMPVSIVLVHLLFMVLVVVFAHYPPVFLGLLLLFLGFTSAYARYQTPLLLREALLVAFFLAGLVVLGGVQAWWLRPVLLGMDSQQVFFGATVLTAITDNAALTYLGSMVEGLSHEFKVALVAGAVTGGGLTVIANAPNPAGVALLREKFPGASIHPAGLLLAALPPTLVAILAFQCL